MHVLHPEKSTHTELGEALRVAKEKAAADELLGAMRALEQQHREASATSFYFVRASSVRECKLERLPRLQEGADGKDPAADCPMAERLQDALMARTILLTALFGRTYSARTPTGSSSGRST